MKTTQQRLQKFAYSVGMIKTVVDNKMGPEQLAEVKKCYVDTKDQFEAHFKCHREKIEELGDQNTQIQKMLGKLMSELQQRDEAIAKIPHNVTYQLNQLEGSIQRCCNNIQQLDFKLANRIDMKTLAALLEDKLDKQTYFELIPLGLSPQQHLEALVTERTNDINARVEASFRHWDKKLAHLRNDIDIGGLRRRLAQMVTENNLNEITEKIDA